MLLKFRNGGTVLTFVQPVAAGGTGAMTAANARANLGVTAGNMGIDDYVVQQGASGIWTYRKWNSGFAECWGVTGMVRVNFVKSSNTTGSTECEWKGPISFPFSFKASPCVLVTQNYADWANSISAVNATTAALTSIGVLKFNTAGNTDGFNISLGIMVRGRWK